ncbi:competence protein CoiA family protein [Azonexus sp. IMCC34839]|uniref:competence protein CoiA family protein n=1 Tax=Azonexus sp. IMCC34839 TaxID=3133695 RepID=UPI00399BDF96
MKADAKPKHGIPFGWHVPTQRMMTAREVANGRGCECVCISCGARLKSRQGDIRIWHFAHDEETECQHAPEAAIHRMAKQLIVERGGLFVPGLERSREIHGKRRVWSETISVTVQAEGFQNLQDCVEEKSVIGAESNGAYRRPDVLATLDGCSLAIEVRNTHAVDFEKQQWLERIGHSVLEISVADLTLLPPDEIVDALAVRLFESADFSEWLVHAKEKEAQEVLDCLEGQVRAAHKSEEDALIARFEADEAEGKRKDEARKRFRDIEDFKIGLGRCTIRLGRNDQRVSLKAYGYAPDDVFDGLKQLARKHNGQFNGRGRCWEFYRYSGTESFFKQLGVELQQVCIERFCAVPPSDAPSLNERRLPEAVVEQPSLVHFQDETLQEVFDERAAIFEFEALLLRPKAEAKALAFVSERLHRSRE